MGWMVTGLGRQLGGSCCLHRSRAGGRRAWGKATWRSQGWLKGWQRCCGPWQISSRPPPRCEGRVAAGVPGTGPGDAFCAPRRLGLVSPLMHYLIRLHSDPGTPCLITLGWHNNPVSQDYDPSLRHKEASAQPGTRLRFLWPGVLSRDLTQLRVCVCAILKLRYNPRDKKKISVLKGTIQWSFSTFTILNKHQHDLTPEHFHHLEKKASPPHSPPSFCGNHQFAVCGCGSACSGIIQDSACGFFLLLCVHACCGVAFRGQ